MNILVTGGAGYIGSHTCVSLYDSGHDVVVVDNLSNSSEISLDRVGQITGRKPLFYKADIRDGEALDRIFTENRIDAVIHFAGLKAVGESVSMPLAYYENNIGGTISLVKAMKRHGVKNIIFSSSACVYGIPESVPISENAKTGCLNPYGWTKLMLEQILSDEHTANPDFNVVILRYFNPVGAHPSGLIGEDPRGIPNNLMPYIQQVAVGRLEKLSVFGNDYPTRDGTGIRDYIHVCDLADGHVLALNKLKDNPGVVIYNLGTGTGYSVLEMVAAFEKACGKKIPYVISDRRPGDAAEVFADPSFVEKEIGFRTKYGLDEMCRDAWNWQEKNPMGYGE